jgi:ABC-type proline/glycine betaine transport system permease subunit
VDLRGWQEITPGVIAVLVGALGLGNLVFFAVSRKLR